MQLAQLQLASILEILISEKEKFCSKEHRYGGYKTFRLPHEIDNCVANFSPVISYFSVLSDVL